MTSLPVIKSEKTDIDESKKNNVQIYNQNGVNKK